MHPLSALSTKCGIHCYCFLWVYIIYEISIKLAFAFEYFGFSVLLLLGWRKINIFLCMTCLIYCTSFYYIKLHVLKRVEKLFHLSFSFILFLVWKPFWNVEKYDTFISECLKYGDFFSQLAILSYMVWK